MSQFTRFIGVFLALIAFSLNYSYAMDMTSGATTTTTSCITNSNSSSCMSYTYSDTSITTDMQGLCSVMGNTYLPACSAWRACMTNSSSVGSSAVCNKFSMLATVCVSENSTSTSCNSYKSLCSTTSMVSQCSTSAPLSYLPTAAVASANLKAACGNTTTGVCAPCQGYWANSTVCKVSNLIELYSQYCYGNSGSSYCTSFTSMCSAYPSLYLCSNVSIAAYSDCMFNPTRASCMNYQYPTALATSDVTSLCTAMPYMPGCTIFRNCNSSGFSAIDSSTDLNACNPFDIMTTICTLDTGMSMMGGCRRAYNTMCATGTMIKECSNYTGMTVLPTTAQANSLSKQICNEMTMDGCSYCDSDWAAGKTYCTYSDLVVLYSYLCYSMPDMTECPTWKAMCASDPTLFLCTFSTNSSYTAGPTMMMYFNTKTPFYLLWKTWTPETNGKLCGAFFAMFFLTLFYEFCQLVKAHLEAYEKRVLAGIRKQKDFNSGADPKGVVVAEVGGCDSRASNGNTESVNTQPFGLHPTLFTIMLDIARMIMAFITSGIGYLLMLGVMCFNVTIFFSVITGFGIGAVLFGRLKMRIGSDACSLSEAMCH